MTRSPTRRCRNLTQPNRHQRSGWCWRGLCSTNPGSPALLQESGSSKRSRSGWHAVHPGYWNHHKPACHELGYLTMNDAYLVQGAKALPQLQRKVWLLHCRTQPDRRRHTHEDKQEAKRQQEKQYMIINDLISESESILWNDKKKNHP